LSKSRYFGTDGIRGRVGEKPISADWILKLGWALGTVLTGTGQRKKVLIGKDTRVSGYMLETALEAGLASAGVDIHLVGPMPTPAVAYLTRTLRMDAGIVISASHNPYFDNGIKFFSSLGTKCSDQMEFAIEAAMDKPMVTVDSKNLGKAVRVRDAQGRYIEFCKGHFPNHLGCNNLKIVLDCANGATYQVAPFVFRELGAELIEMGVKPDGFNINAGCGSTHPQLLSEAVLLHKADLGIAFDGDGDRVLMVDHTGTLVDGDELLYIIAKWYSDTQRLTGGVVGTVMSNLGLELAFKELNIPFARTQVGDRYVLEKLQENNWNLGGEGSGHIICLDANTTGDGIMSALRVLACMQSTERSLAELKKGMNKYPQILINVPLSLSLGSTLDLNQA
jgi:phosphoglucosamine mutase